LFGTKTPRGKHAQGGASDVLSPGGLVRHCCRSGFKRKVGGKKTTMGLNTDRPQRKYRSQRKKKCAFGK